MTEIVKNETLFLTSTRYNIVYIWHPETKIPLKLFNYPYTYNFEIMKNFNKCFDFNSGFNLVWWEIRGEQ